MSAQPTLFDPGPQDGGLTHRQQVALDAVLAEPDGLSTDEVGAILHELKNGRWKHERGERCEYCGRDGRAVLEALRERGLVRRNRLGVYRPGDVKQGPAPAAAETTTFADTGDDIPF